MAGFWRRLRRNELGATAIEYCLIAAIISIGLLLSLQFVAGETGSMWDNIVSSVTT